MAFATPAKGGKFLPVPGAPTAAPKSPTPKPPAARRGAPAASPPPRVMQPSQPAAPKGPYIGAVSKYGKGTGKKK